jgi:serine/threonine protein phosphatase PrpC
MIGIRMAACSEQGARKYNEDALAHGQARNGHFAVLCDGAGGHKRGAEAAQRAVACVERLLRDDAVAFSPANLTQMVRLAHSELQSHQESEFADARMHCTIVVLWIDPAQAHVLWTHVGDSRLYRFRHGEADVVTADDSVVQRMVQSGLIRPEQTQDHPQKNQLLAALGMDGEIDPNTVVRPVELIEGDAFLLATDGWWGTIDDGALSQSLARALDPGQWLADMREQINARAVRGQDNFSAIAVWVGDPGEVTNPDADDTKPRGVPVLRNPP